MLQMSFYARNDSRRWAVVQEASFVPAKVIVSVLIDMQALCSVVQRCAKTEVLWGFLKSRDFSSLSLRETLDAYDYVS